MLQPVILIAFFAKCIRHLSVSFCKLKANRVKKGLYTSYFDLGCYEVSPNNELLCYSTDTKGDERYTLYIKHISSGLSFNLLIANW